MTLTRTGRGLGPVGEASAWGDGCEECRAPGDVFVDGRLFCARCALVNHYEGLGRDVASTTRPTSR